ncbi:response regulator [Azohydromonas lata]|uniref:response regulator n=1 Tax=Azohydromonas lata TaxID=45677 RepID=UPI00082CFDC3|nr:response regulator [Azohydromonas lata]
MTMVSSPSILLIDDDPKQIQFLAAILRRHDYRVFAALDGRDGLAKAAAKPPDLILVDLYMPDIDGQATIRLFKAHPTLQHIPLICLTVSNHIDDKLSAFEAGAVDYITKPFDPEEVLARVRVHLRLHQAGAPQPVLPPPPAPSVEGSPQPWEERLVTQAQSVLLREMGNPPSLAELAQRVGTTQRHLSHEFRRQVGVAVFAWLREERHREACFRLLHTSQQLNQIGHHIGYQSAAAFTNAFRARFGMTPSDYRRAAGVRVPEADAAAVDEGGRAQGDEDVDAGGYAAG